MEQIFLWVRNREYVAYYYFFILGLVLGAVDPLMALGPLDPREHVSKETEDHLQGTAQTLFKIGTAKGEFKHRASEEAINLYRAHPSYDQLVLKSKLIYLYCTLLDSANWSPSEQRGMLVELSKSLDMAPPEAEAGADSPKPKPPTACPPSSPINMVGQVASDIPGTPLQLCQAVTSVIDKRTLPIDVYSVQLQAGQSVKFRIQCNEFCSLSLWNPNTIDVRSTAVGAAVFTVRSNYNHEVFKVYTAAVADTYPVSIRAARSDDRYIASVQPVQ